MKTLISKETYLTIDSAIVRFAPGWFVDFCAKVRIAYKKRRMPEQRKTFGELNPDKTFFVIRLYPPATGFLANYIYVLGYMDYAEERGWIPVVDMENYDTLYSTGVAVNGTNNVWEHYFLQPETMGVRYSLEEVYSSKNVILSNGTMDECYYTSFDKNDEKYIKQVRQSQRIDFQPSLKAHMESVYSAIIPSGEKIIGAIIREGGYTQGMHGHSAQCTADEMVQILTDRQKKWNGSYYFVKAETVSSLETIKSELPNVLHTDAHRVSTFSKTIMVAEENDDYLESNITSLGNENISNLPKKYLSTVEYLTEIYILSKCDSLVGSFNNGLYAAFIWNDGRYENFEVINKEKEIK